MYPRHISLRSRDYSFIDMSLLQAKRLIALHWKNIKAPRVGSWVKEMAINMSMEKITYIVRGKYGKFEEIWNPFFSFLEHGGVDGMSLNGIGV